MAFLSSSTSGTSITEVVQPFLRFKLAEPFTRTSMKILVSTSTFCEFDSTPLEKLKACGFELMLNPYARRLQPQESVELLQGVHGLIAGTELLNCAVLSKASSLKVISRCGVGTDNVDLDAAKELGIEVISTPVAPTEAVAELTLGLMVALTRRVVEADRLLRRGSWKPLMGSLLEGKTLGVIGLGRIGKRLTQLVQPLRMSLLAHEPFPDSGFVSQHQVRLVSLRELFAQADIVSLHVALTAETRHLIRRETLGLMKSNALVINTSRGEVVDESALLEALEAGRIGGAALDVYGEEPYQGPLTENNKVILTAHMGSYAKEARVQMESEAVDNLLHILNPSAATFIS
jgi:D-3-phosphoglycerate dehydrogenase